MIAEIFSRRLSCTPIQVLAHLGRIATHEGEVVSPLTQCAAIQFARECLVDGSLGIIRPVQREIVLRQIAEGNHIVLLEAEIARAN